MTELVADVCNVVRKHIEQKPIAAADQYVATTAGDSGPTPSAAPADPSTEVRHSSSVPDEAPPVGHAGSAAPADVLPPLELGLDLRGQDLGVPKVPEQEPQEGPVDPTLADLAADALPPTVAPPAQAAAPEGPHNV